MSQRAAPWTKSTRSLARLASSRYIRIQRPRMKAMTSATTMMIAAADPLVLRWREVMSNALPIRST